MNKWRLQALLQASRHGKGAAAVHRPGQVQIRLGQPRPSRDLQQCTVVATEAFARWRRPGRGLTSPGEFIAIAEEVGLIKDLGETVLRPACLAGAAREGGVAVSVNVSARQFAQDDFGAVVKRALRESGLPPSSCGRN